MALVNSSFTVNVTPGAMPPTVHVSEYDIGRTYTVTINGQNGSAFNIPTGTTATVEGTLNGVIGFNTDATISGSTVSFTLTESMTAKSGKAWCKIKLTLNDEPIQTCAFILDVDRAGVEAETVIGAPGFEKQINQGVAEYFDNDPPFFELPSGGQSGQALLSDGADGAVWGEAGIPSAVKTALLACIRHIGIWDDENGAAYYEALYNALYGSTPPVEQYQDLDYIYADGNAYFNTNIFVSLGYKVRVKAHQLEQATGNSKTVCGGTVDGEGIPGVAFLSFSITSGYVGAWYGSTNCFTTLQNYNASPVESETIVRENGMSFNASNASGSNSATASGSGFVGRNLLVCWHGTTTNYAFKGRIYYIQVLDGNDNLVANLVGKKRLSDNAVGMLDTVSGVFYTSDTDTPFVAS